MEQPVVPRCCQSPSDVGLHMISASHYKSNFVQIKPETSLCIFIAIGYLVLTTISISTIILKPFYKPSREMEMSVFTVEGVISHTPY